LLLSIATSCTTSATTGPTEMVHRALFFSLVFLACIAGSVGGEFHLSKTYL